MDASSLSSTQDQFVEMLPHIERIASYRFRYLDPEAREEAVEEATALAWRNYPRCQRQGKSPGASPLAHYACLNVKGGRGVCGESSTDVTSSKAQKMGRTRVLNMNKVPSGNGAGEDSWDLSEALADRRVWERPPWRARVDLDYADFLDRGGVNDQEARVFRLLSEGYRTGEIADRIGVSAPRVCQVKNSLGRKLEDFFGPGVSRPSGPAPLRASYVTPP